MERNDLENILRRRQVTARQLFEKAYRFYFEELRLSNVNYALMLYETEGVIPLWVGEYCKYLRGCALAGRPKKI